MNLKNKIKYLFVICCCFIFVSSLTGCSKSKTNLTALQVEEDLKIILSKDYSVDLITNLHFDSASLTDEEKNELQSKYTGDINYDKIYAEFTMKSMEVDISAKYDIVYVMIDGKWEVAVSTPIDKENWKYTSKEKVDVAKIMKDFKEYEFDGFEKGYIGEESTTFIQVEGRKTSEDNTRDEVSISMEIKTDFAKYSMNGKVLYTFTGGKWVFNEVFLDDTSQWKIDYLGNPEPPKPDKNIVLDALINKDNILTCVVEKDKNKNYSLSEPASLVQTSKIVFRYKFKVSYNGFGTVEYNVYYPMEWVDGNWQNGQISTKYILSNFDEMVGTWKSSDGKESFEIKNIKNDEATIVYIKDEKEYNLIGKIAIPIKPNDWHFVITTDDESKNFDKISLTFDLYGKKLTNEKTTFSKLENDKKTEDNIKKK